MLFAVLEGGLEIIELLVEIVDLKLHSISFFDLTLLHSICRCQNEPVDNQSDVRGAVE